MYKKYTAKDIMIKARSVALSKSVKQYPQGKFKYLDHVLVVEYEDCGDYVVIQVKMEKTTKGSKIKEIVYENEYLW